MILRLISKAKEIYDLPKVSINLMHDKTQGNDPFFAKVVSAFYKEANSRHRKFPLVRRIQYGMAVCELPKKEGAYFEKIESSARRNHRKAIREGCVFRRIRFNDHLDEIRDIWLCTDFRQGKLMPASMLAGDVRPISDPESRSTFHDYPYYGVFFEDKMVGYMGCLIAGELGGIQQIYGHSKFLTLGVVPQLLIGFAGELIKSYPSVKYMTYGNYYGAGETMQRFKRKFLMFPHKVTWIL